MERQDATVDTVAAILDKARGACKIVFVSGNFNVVPNTQTR